jgi:hypothetical protein
VKIKMRQIKYFSENFAEIDTKMNDWIVDNKHIINFIYKIHISREQFIDATAYVNGYIDYDKKEV